MKRRLALAWFLSGSALMLIPFTVFLKTSASNSGSKSEAPLPGRLGDQVTVRAQGRGAPTVNLADGRQTLTTYAGEAEAQRQLLQNLAQPLAMASADFDEDGVADLVAGYAAPGGGILTLHRGNVDSIYPNMPEAQQRKANGSFTDAPFLSPARVFETSRPVDFIGCGDFDADGHWDVVTATKGTGALFVFLGDGDGNLGAVRRVELPGRITALATGEINRADGLADIVVGVSAPDGPQALVFEAPNGALRANPKVFPLPTEATGLEIGQFDNDFPMDLAIASGHELIVIHGQEPTRTVNRTNRARAPEPIYDRRSFRFAINAVVAGDFSGNRHDDIALLLDDGVVHVLSRAEAVRRRAQKMLRVQKWRDKTLPGAWPQARRLDRARVSSLPVDNLLVIDSTNQRLEILTSNSFQPHSLQAPTNSASIGVEGEPVAVLPMRLNADALSDLVILRNGRVAPSVSITSPAMTFPVTNNNDAGAGSLRDAIINANANAGADLITFNIGGGGAQTINLAAAMQEITDAVTIDATTQPGFAGNPLIELSGSLVPVEDGFLVSGGGTTIRGLVINRFPANGVHLTASNNVIEKNFIGTNAAGTDNGPNGGSGVLIDGGAANLIGGTTGAASNLISGNVGAGVQIINSASGNSVQGDFIGTRASGTLALPNGASGVAVGITSSNNVVGGSISGAGNLISGNTGSGVVLFSSATGSLVQGNRIGVDASGTAALANTAGVTITSGAAGSTIGGTVSGAGNIIAFNSGTGVVAPSGSGNAILGNSIFSNVSIGIDISDDSGVTPNDPCDVDVGPNSLQNFPVLTSATSGGGSTTIVGSLDSDPSSAFRVEFFSTNACDPSGFGEGQTFLGSATVNTGAACTGPINVILPGTVGPGQVITATATNAANETSEFSQCVSVIALGPVSDLQITNSDAPDPVVSGSNITYTIAIANNGPDPDAGVTFTDVLPAGTTFVSLTSPGACSAPPLGGTGTVSCSLGALVSGGSVSITLVVKVTAAPGATITNIAAVSGMSGDPNSLNNSATASTAVVSGTPCTLTCPPDLLRFTPANATSCGAVVTFSPITSGGCLAVMCAPPSGSVFAVGATTVSCTAIDAPPCSFSVTVVDDTPPRIVCSTGVTAPLPPGQTSAVVNYPAATAIDNCTSASVACAPPSGSSFPPGSTLITCTATDAFENSTRCFFFVTLLDTDSPVITCPVNVSVALAPGQTSAVVTYPAPTATDNLPGVNVVCTPASGSSFPAGATTVTCTATDIGGNKASCSFTVGVGGSQAKVTLPGGKTAVEFAAAATRKPPKPKNNPCSVLTLQNIGFAPLVLTLDSISRTGSSVDSGRITDPNDTRFFSLSLVNADQSLSALDIGATLTLQAGQTSTLCAKFNALIPALAGKTTGLAASNVLPDVVASTIVFRQNAGANIVVPLAANVSTALVLVNLSNPRTPPQVSFTRNGNDITVSYAVFDSNLNVTRAKYEFLDSGGQVVAGPFEIDLTASISSANLVRGQSFSVEQRFTGASSNPEVIGVRLTVFDGETSVTAPSTSSATPVSAATIQLMNRTRRVTLYPPDQKLTP